MIFKVLLSIVLLLSLNSAIGQGTRIEFTAPESYPEGIAYDSTNDIFYVSSVRTGTIGKVDRSGKYTIVYADSTLKSSFGMKIAEMASRLWICVGDPSYSKYRDSSTYKKMIRLVGIDLNNGKKIADINLSNLYQGSHFANDLTLDEKGNAYITDSYSPVIYKVDGSGNSSVFAESPLFSSIGVGLNGIVWHPGGFLIVANNGNGCLLKVDLIDPKKINRVSVSQFFPGVDGLLFDQQQRLILVQNKGVNKIFQLSSTDNWQTATVKAATPAAAMLNFPSTVTMRRGETWVVNAKLHELSDSTTVLSKTFSLQKAEWRPVNK